MRDENLMDRSRRLPQAIRPKTDLWAGIEQEIKPRSQFARFSVAIAATLVLGVGAFVWQLAAVSGESSSVIAAEPISANIFASHEYGLMKAELMVGFQEELAASSPETREVIARNMATIAAAIEDINTALAKDPDNYLLQRMLATTYTNELKLITQTQQLSRSVRQRTQI